MQLSWFFAEIPYMFTVGALFSSIFYFTCGYDVSADKFFTYWLFLKLYLVFTCYFGQMIGTLSRSTCRYGPVPIPVFLISLTLYPTSPQRRPVRAPRSRRSFFPR